jgi:ankyrin repeat protein
MSSTPLTKENTLFKTLEIKSSKLHSFQDNIAEILKFYIKDGNFVKFKDLFEKNKYLIDKLDDNGDSLLNISVKCNHFEIASYLLDNGADVNSQNVIFYCFFINLKILFIYNTLEKPKCSFTLCSIF